MEKTTNKILFLFFLSLSVIIHFAGNSIAYDMRAISPKSEEFKEKHEPFLAEIIEVLDVGKIKVLYHGKEEVVKVRWIASGDEIKQAVKDDHGYPQITQKELSFYARQIPAIVNYMRILLPKGSKVRLDYYEADNQMPGYVLANILLLNEWQGFVTFSSLHTKLIVGGFAVISKEKWDLPVISNLELDCRRDSDVAWFNITKRSKQGIWADSTKTNSVHANVGLPLDLDPVLAVPLVKIYYDYKKSSDISLVLNSF